MGLKMDEVRFETGASCMSGSLVMPGGVMEPWSTLIEHSQVLKGETVPVNRSFGGLPARPLPAAFRPWSPSEAHARNFASTRVRADQPGLKPEVSQVTSKDRQPLLLEVPTQLQNRSAGRLLGNQTTPTCRFTGRPGKKS